MSLRSSMLVAVALTAAGLTGFLSYSWLEAQREAYAARPTVAKEVEDAMVTAEVLVAAEPLPTGTFVQAAHMRWQDWPMDAVSEDHVVKDAGSADEFAGAVVRTYLTAGEPITRARVVHPGEQGFLAAVLRPGMRAVSVPVDAASGIAGFVFPGDRVDVIVTFDVKIKSTDGSQSGSRHFSETLVNQVRVLAVDQSLDGAISGAQLAKTVTLEVDQKQAEKLALGLDIGTLSLALRSLIETAGRTAGSTEVAVNQRETRPSYVQDIDALFALRDAQLGGGGTHSGSSVHVLHGTEAEQVSF